VKRRGSIQRKYVVLVVALVGGALLVSGLVSMYRSYVDTRAALLAVEREHAVSASIRIENFVDSIERQIGWTSLPQVVASTSPLEARRFDYVKLLRQVKEITEATYIDPQGREQVSVSRLRMDALGSGKDLSADPRFKVASEGQTYFGPVYFRKETEPYMAIAVPAGRRGAGVTAVEVNLKFMWEVIRGIRVGKTGFAYVVDRQGRLIAHPDISLVLQITNLSSLPQVQAALPREGVAETVLPRVSDARDLAGKSVLTASARIESLGWTVFVEQSADEAYQPLYASLMRTAGLLVAGLLLSMIAGFVFARRMVEPIRALQAGADAIGAGDLGKRIEVRTGDELEALGERFNEMASKLAASYAGLERKVEERTEELQNALERQTATSEVLRAISGSPTDTGPVFDAILNRVVGLGEADSAVLFLYDGDVLRATGGVGTDAELFDRLRENPPRPATWNPTLLAALERRTVHSTDVLDFPGFRPLTGGEMTRDDPWRTVLAVPLMREGALVGVIAVWRKTVRPFSDRQIELVSTFADQAVIAIENVRLFNETTEALEQQTATAEILRAISASPSDVAPVFETILDSATRLCDSPLSAVFRYEGGVVHLVSHRNWSPSSIEEMKKYYPGPPNSKMISGRTILSGTLQEEEDTHADSGYDQRVAQTGGWRRMLGVPIKRGARVLGAVIVGWPTPGKTPERQMRLLETFADQAAIAIENVRLFNETKEALERQTATAEILQVISGSPTDVQPVLDTIARRAVQLCDSLFANLFRYDGEQLHFVASHNVAPEQREMMGGRYPMRADHTQVSGRVVLRNAIVRMEDALADPGYDSRFAKAGGWRRMLGVPMTREGRMLGAIVVGWREAGPVSPVHEMLLKTFADQAAIAIENVRLFHEIEEKSRQLEIANKHKSDFLANMSHELRTPLNAIIGFSEVLIEKMFGEVNDKQLDYLQDIHSSGRHLLSLINDILDLSKIEAGRMELDLSEVSVPDTLSSAMTLVRERAQNHGIDLGLEVDAKIGVIQADERKVKQVVVNLLSNAVKFTPDGGKVTMRATLDTDHVEVAVQDTGIGIAPEDQEAVFEEFKQVGRDYTKKAEGTGLGLALTKRIVELHGGRIWLDSAPGKGSTFTFTLPLTQEKGAP
jgi:signal transduction histidine kinase